MRSLQFCATNLNRLRRQVIAWRRSRPAHGAIPDELWESAATLARSHGASRVSRTLHLDFYKIRRRLREAPTSPPAPTFVEISCPSPATSGGATCAVELSDARGANLRMHLPADAPTLVALAEAFWRRPR